MVITSLDHFRFAGQPESSSPASSSWPGGTSPLEEEVARKGLLEEFERLKGLDPVQEPQEVVSSLARLGSLARTAVASTAEQHTIAEFLVSFIPVSHGRAAQLIAPTLGALRHEPARVRRLVDPLLAHERLHVRSAAHRALLESDALDDRESGSARHVIAGVFREQYTKSEAMAEAIIDAVRPLLIKTSEEGDLPERGSFAASTFAAETVRSLASPPVLRAIIEGARMQRRADEFLLSFMRRMTTRPDLLSRLIGPYTRRALREEIRKDKKDPDGFIGSLLLPCADGMFPDGELIQTANLLHRVDRRAVMMAVEANHWDEGVREYAANVVDQLDSRPLRYGTSALGL